MTPTGPKTEQFLIPDGTRGVTFLGPRGSTNISPLETLLLPDGRVVSQWRLDPNELELLKNGAPVTLVLHSGGQVPPIQLGVGGFDLREPLT